MKFESEISCKTSDGKGLWFIFSRGALLCREADGCYSVPVFESLKEAGAETGTPLYLGKADSLNCWTAEAEAADTSFPENKVLPGLKFVNLRETYHHLGDEMFALACRALQLCSWKSSWNFCPACGATLNDSSVERAMVCPSCSKNYYPVISPAIIVAVTKGRRILLARNNRHRGFKRFSILAGFVEAGESLEETVMREVEEEVGIKVKNIKYFGSQSWPFPHSLMIGFTAEHESGEIRVDGDEIGEAAWFRADELPDIPPYGSISRVLIDNFVKSNS